MRTVWKISAYELGFQHVRVGLLTRTYPCEQILAVTHNASAIRLGDGPTKCRGNGSREHQPPHPHRHSPDMLNVSPVDCDASHEEKCGHRKSYGYEWISASHAAAADKHAAHGEHGASGFLGHRPHWPHHANGTRATSQNWVISDHTSLHLLLQQIRANRLLLHM